MDKVGGTSGALALSRCLRLTLAVLLELGLAFVLIEQVAVFGSIWLFSGLMGPNCSAGTGICEPGPLVFLAIMAAVPAFFAGWLCLYFGISAWRGRSPAMILLRIPPRSRRPQGLVAYLAGDDRRLVA